MFVGVLRLSLDIVGARSLKDKRSVVKSLKERVQGRLRVSIAEVGALDDPRRATLGGQHFQESLDVAIHSVALELVVRQHLFHRMRRRTGGIRPEHHHRGANDDHPSGNHDEKEPYHRLPTV